MYVALRDFSLHPAYARVPIIQPQVLSVPFSAVRTLKTVTSQGISVELLDSATISISDFSKCAQSFPVCGPTLYSFASHAHMFEPLTGWKIASSLWSLSKGSSITTPVPIRVKCFAVVNVIQVVICPEMIHPDFTLLECLPLPVDYRAIIFVQLANALGKNIFEE